MAFKNLSKEEKLSLLDNLTWDYNVTSEDLLSIIEKNSTRELPFSEKTLFARCLETFTWEELISLWGLERAKLLYTPEVSRMIFPKLLREEYDNVFSLLQRGTLSRTGQSPEYIERLRTFLLFNRRNRCEQRVFKSPLLRRPRLIRK